MTPYDGDLVLTINPLDHRKPELSSAIHDAHAPVYISQVAGFGQPELRVGPGEYVHGVPAIMNALRDLRLAG